MLIDVIYGLLATIESTYGNIYPGKAPQEASTPYLVQFQVSNDAEATKETTSIADHIRWQISAFSETYRQAQTIAEAVRTILDGYTGTVDGVTILDTEFDGEFAMYEEDARLHHIAQDYMFIIKK